MRLQSKPLASVYLSLATTDDSECVLAEYNVEIAPGDWLSGAALTVVGVDDLLYDLDQPCGVVVDGTSSEDPLYNSLDVVGTELISFTNVDDDEAGIVCVPLVHATSEAATLLPTMSVVTLTSQPLQPVSISYASSDETEGVATGTIVLDASNWLE